MFIKAKEISKKRVKYWNEDGTSLTYVGGNRTWRNQNPGNLGAGPWANRHGAIGKAGGFAVFPDYESGRAAIFDWWMTPDHRALSIWDAVIAISRTGNLYLKSRPDKDVSNNLDNLA